MLEEIVGRGRTYSDIQIKALERYVYRRQNPTTPEWEWVVAALASTWKWKELPSTADILDKLQAARLKITGKTRQSTVKIPCSRCLAEGYLWTRRDRWDPVEIEDAEGLDATGQEPLGRAVIRCGCENSPPGKDLSYLALRKADLINPSDFENSAGMRMDETPEDLKRRKWDVLEGLIKAGRGDILLEYQMDQLMGNSPGFPENNKAEIQKQIEKVSGASQDESGETPPF